MSIDHWNAKHYHQSSDMQYHIALDILADEHFNAEDTILDIGCGSGRVTADIATLVPQNQVTGVDLSENMIAFAKQQYKVIKNLNFITGDVLNLQLDSKLTKIFTFSMLQWVTDFHQAFSQVYLNLKSQGRFVGGYFLKCPQIWDFLDELITTPSWRKYFENYDSGFYQHEKEYCQSALKQAGFQPQIIELSKDFIFKDKESAINHTKNWLPHLSRLPKDKVDYFLSELANLIMNKSRVNDKGYIITNCGYIIFHASKL
ncbi:Trans-aconitate 2-methyltransferase [Piscirickettsia salmonis]|uniref:class I SAM-dependent methyltransferase n=1 Tax=Piscirickettsia salmonis TaxID=1238 RepID=UPI0012BAD572|nr:class I SAM-dependent methyltransferase [Piscirickettsia salmonis]QGP54504.1 Trans-aconitate 2-methyltransferase [Piscirickettsia salmonis]QGP59615.1 Trans-aconitate 2-methyltransferase [Piscirickettsia salmonis]QGP64299.1 Trans-aconitate 2-methyltransferase [Piscirickettsia salmonis]